MQIQEPLEPISLGAACTVKFQICRHLYQAAYPGASAQPVRDALHGGRAGQVFPRHLFDWQVTPPATVAAYLECDFEGVFEREDLEIIDRGEVMHRTLRTWHPHDFHPVDGTFDQAELDRQYPVARSRFDHLAQRFRDHLREPGPFLYVVSERPAPQIAQAIIVGLSRWPQHRFRILFADVPAASNNLSHLDARILEAFLPEVIDKPEALQWEGDDAAWDRIFAKVPMRIRGGRRFSRGLKRLAEAAPPRPALPLAWRRLPGHFPAGPAPQTFTAPPEPWGYAAMSEALSPHTGDRGAIVVGVEALEGVAGISLTNPDGDAILGAEHRLEPDEGRVMLRLPVTVARREQHLLIRNYGPDSVSAVVRMDWVCALPEGEDV